MIGDFATAGAGASGASGTLSMARGDVPRSATSPRPDATTLTQVAHARPPGPIGVRMFYVMCWVIYAGTAIQWLAAH